MDHKRSRNKNESKELIGPKNAHNQKGLQHKGISKVIETAIHFEGI